MIIVCSSGIAVKRPRPLPITCVQWITRDMELLRDPSVGVGRRDQLEMNVEGCKDAIKQSQQLIEVIKLILHYKVNNYDFFEH